MIEIVPKLTLISSAKFSKGNKFNMAKLLSIFILFYIILFSNGVNANPTTFQEERKTSETGSPWLSSSLLTPHITVKDPQKSKQFYHQVLGFDLRHEVVQKGVPVHVEMSYLGDLILMFVPEKNLPENKIPKRQYFYLYVKDIESVVNKAKQFNAIVLESPHKAAWGDQFALITDPDGYHWGLAQADIFPGKMEAKLKKNTQVLAKQPPLPMASAIEYEKEVLTKAKEIPLNVDIIRDIAYGDNPQQRFDVFSSADAKPSSPILIFWHGGGFTNGYKEYSQFITDTVTRMGVILVTPTYRLAPENRLPAAYNDAEALVKEVIKKAHLFHGDPGSIYLAGHSAGGTIAAMTCLKMDALFSDKPKANPIKGCLPISGIMDLASENPPLGSLEERVYTSLLAKKSDDKLMSPINHAIGTHTPFFLMYGEKDSERVIKSNQRMFNLMENDRKNASIQQYQQPGEDHFAVHLGLENERNVWFSMLKKMVEQ